MSAMTDFLFARPSLLEGIARLFDFSNALNRYNESLTARDADELAMWMDWYVIGQDIVTSVSQFEQDQLAHR